MGSASRTVAKLLCFPCVSGVVMPIRSSGTGLLGCGLPSQDGVELLEALKWAGETLNHQDGEDGESFIPGVKLGMCTQYF